MKNPKGKERKNKLENNHKMDAKAALGALLIVALSIGIFILADALFPFRRMEFGGDGFQLMQNFFLLTTAISSLMFVISVYLLFIYLKDYLELKSGFTLGILLAVVSFLLFAVSSNPILHMLFGIFGKEGAFTLIPMVFALLSLAILAWVSSK